MRHPHLYRGSSEKDTIGHSLLALAHARRRVIIWLTSCPGDPDRAQRPWGTKRRIPPASRTPFTSAINKMKGWETLRIQLQSRPQKGHLPGRGVSLREMPLERRASLSRLEGGGSRFFRPAGRLDEPPRVPKLFCTLNTVSVQVRVTACCSPELGTIVLFPSTAPHCIHNTSLAHSKPQLNRKTNLCRGVSFVLC